MYIKQLINKLTFLYYKIISLLEFISLFGYPYNIQINKVTNNNYDEKFIISLVIPESDFNIGMYLKVKVLYIINNEIILDNYIGEIWLERTYYKPIYDFAVNNDDNFKYISFNSISFVKLNDLLEHLEKEIKYNLKK